ncbi:TPA_asm: hypothetical protein vir556_00027 [dsDNA virus vir556]|nr:TPA_asm: hypothetical protein vir556_00027 [dsDNA virus vir556]
MLFSSRRRRGSQRGYFTVIENNLAGEVFDPTLTTLVPTTVIWSSSDGYTAVTTGTTHDISYTVPADGPRTWHIYCGIGLSSIRTFDMREDKLVHIDVSLLRSATSMVAYTNASLVMKLTDLPIGLTYANFGADPLLTGDIATLPIGLTIAYFGSDPLLTGDIATLPIGLTIAYFSYDPLLTGDISTLPIGLTHAYFFYDPSLTAGSIASLSVIRDIRLYSIGWNAASVDTVLLSVSDAIHANVNHFTYATPSLQIGGTNASPGGTPSAATTDPLTTPGSGNSDTDWQWDAVAGKHKALTGMAAIWVMRNNTGHAWTVTATGVA